MSLCIKVVLAHLKFTKSLLIQADASDVSSGTKFALNVEEEQHSV